MTRGLGWFYIDTQTYPDVARAVGEAPGGGRVFKVLWKKEPGMQGMRKNKNESKDALAKRSKPCPSLVGPQAS